MNLTTFQFCEWPDSWQSPKEDPDCFRRAITAWYANTDDGNTALRPLVSVVRESIDSTTATRVKGVSSPSRARAAAA